MEKLDEKAIHEKWRTLIYYRNMFSLKRQAILKASTEEEKIKFLKEAYLVFKESSYFYFEDKDAFGFLLQDIYNLEKLLSSYYICDTEINMEKEFPIYRVSSHEQFLDYLVSDCRNKLLKELKIKDPSIKSINDSDLSNNCKLAGNKLKKSFYNYNIFKKSNSCEIIIIYPGFIKGRINNNYNYHCFCIISLDNKKYLIDCTYKQFFLTSFNIPDCIELVGYAGCDPGFYMLEDSYRKQIAMQLLKRGWIEISEESFKAYLDGFALSFRNGLYYESLGYIDYNTNYSAKDYCNFLLGNDNQLNYEKEEYLGLQKRPLFNNSLDFTSK